MTDPGEVQAFFRDVVLPYKGSKCLIWPYANAGGYAQIKKDGKVCLVTRLICEHFKGPPPTPKHEAAHSCGKGHKGCVNPNHLDWKTTKENEADKIGHGTTNRGERCGMHKLTEFEVREILSLKGKLFQYEIAERFDVSEQQVYRILHKKSWKHLKRGCKHVGQQTNEADTGQARRGAASDMGRDERPRSQPRQLALQRLRRGRLDERTGVR